MPKDPSERKNRDRPARADKPNRRQEKGDRDMKFDDRIASVPVGGKITGINVGKKNAEMMKIEVNGDVVARVHKRDLPALGIKVGTVWSAEVADRVTAGVSRTKIRNAAKTLLEEKQVPRNELVEKLTGRGHDRQVVEQVVGEI